MYERKNIMKMNIKCIYIRSAMTIGYPIQEFNWLSVHHQMCTSTDTNAADNAMKPLNNGHYEASYF